MSSISPVSSIRRPIVFRIEGKHSMSLQSSLRRGNVGVASSDVCEEKNTATSAELTSVWRSRCSSSRVSEAPSTRQRINAGATLCRPPSGNASPEVRIESISAVRSNARVIPSGSVEKRIASAYSFPFSPEQFADSSCLMAVKPILSSNVSGYINGVSDFILECKFSQSSGIYY